MSRVDQGEGVRVLCIDNYDSFVYTIVGYLTRLGAQVDVRRNDDVPLADVREGAYAGVLVSPGPSSPDQAGSSIEAIDLCAQQAIPLLGVCLGHQALGQWAGARIVHAPELMHGKTSSITHIGEGVFEGLPSPLTVTRYHSLTIDPDTVPDTLQVTATTDSGIIMGVRHRVAPFEGVQFHPEAVMTEHGYSMLGRWLERVGVPGAYAQAQGFSPQLAR